MRAQAAFILVSAASPSAGVRAGSSGVRLFFVQALILAAVVVAVAAVFFQSRGARELLRTLRNAAWVYVALLFVLGGIEVIRRNLL